jgi:hypothetical protein
MPDDELTTRVDDLLDLLKKQEKIPMEDAADELDVDLESVQSWVDFLVEERIVGIEYKFTKPYIYLNEPEDVDQADEEDDIKSFEGFKENFMEKAAEKQIPEENRHNLWQNHVEKVLSRKKDYFMQEADKRNLQNADELWDEYKEKLLS